MLEKALAMSRDPGAGSSATTAPKPVAAAAAVDFGSMSEDEQIAYAMQMSMQENATEAGKYGSYSIEISML
jgi:26S proteasome regulatory subunit N10